MIAVRGLDNGYHALPSLTRPLLSGAYRTWLISSGWPPGSRKNARISALHATGGVKNTARRVERTAWAAWQFGTRIVMAWLTRSRSLGGAKVTVGLSGSVPHR